jgi:phospholipase C
VGNVIDHVKRQDDWFDSTAIFVTFDEGGGYWDSGFFQPIDVFGDGPRIPMIVVSPYSRGRRYRAQLRRPRVRAQVHRAELGAIR